MKNLLIKFLWMVSFLLFVTTNAHAYIDPGTGALWLQLIAAGLAGGAFYFKNSIAKIISIFKSTPKDNDKKTNEE